MRNLDKCVIRWFVIWQERLNKEGFHFSSQKIIRDCTRRLVSNFVHKEVYESLQFLKKNCMLSSNTFSWLFIDVDIEVLNHIKFSYVLLLIILLLSMGVLMLKRLYSYCVIPNN